MTEYGSQFAPPPSRPAAPGPTYGTPSYGAPSYGAPNYPTGAPGYPPPQGYPHAAPGYPPAPPGYPNGAPGYPPAQGYPGAAPGYPAVPPVPAGQRVYQGTPQGQPCRLCGSVPTANVTFRQHTGMLLMMRFGSLKGPFCRDCGLHVFRKMSAHTLLAGWWGWASFFITPITLLINLARRGSVARLDPPVPQVANRTPADPGKPLYQRPAILGLLVPVVALIVLIFAISTSSDSSSPSGVSLVGKCVQADSADPGAGVDFVDCGKPHQGKVTLVTTTKESCPADTLFTLRNADDSSDNTVVCVGRD
jgi:hypothetical protein